MTLPEWTAINLATANLAKAGHDQRTPDQYLADLERETEQSLRKHPERRRLPRCESTGLNWRVQAGRKPS